MSWKRIENPDREERRALVRDFGRKIRFLVDESLDPALILVLDELGWKAESAADAGLSGKSDEDVFGYAWRKKQFLLTSDKDFLDDRRFPPHRNTGVIILPNAPIDSDSFITAMRQALYTIAPLGRAYRGSKIVITAEGEISIIVRNNDTGAMEKMRFRIDRQGNTFLWEDEPTQLHCKWNSKRAPHDYAQDPGPWRHTGMGWHALEGHRLRGGDRLAGSLGPEPGGRPGGVGGK